MYHRMKACLLITLLLFSYATHAQTGEEYCKTGNTFYEQGNYTEAVKNFKKSGESGFPAAWYNLGICYLNGNGVDSSETEAAQLFLKAAALGHIKAQNNIAGFYIS